MLDPKLIRDQPEKVRKMIRDRAVKFDFDNMIELDKKRRDLIKETENSIISMDDEIEELTLSANVPINHIMEIKNRISKKHGLDLEEYTKYEGDAENSSNNLTTSSIDVNS